MPAGENVVKMLGALEDYYGRPYTDVQRRVIAQHLGNLPYEYTLDLYRVVINRHEPTQQRPIPDLPRFRECQAEMNPPEAYRQAALPDPDDLETEKDPALMTKVMDELNSRKRNGELNREYRERLRQLVAKGDATKDQEYQIRVIDEFGGDWRTAWAKIGGEYSARSG